MEAWSPTQSSSIQEDGMAPTVAKEVSLAAMFNALVRGYWIIGVCCLVAALGAVAYLRLSPVVYTAKMVVAPVKERSGGEGRGASLLSALVSGTDGVADDFSKFLQLLSSHEVASALGQETLREVFRSRWDDQAQAWLPSTGYRMELKRVLDGVIGRGTPDDVDAIALANFIDGAVTIEPIKRSGLYSISLTYGDPDYAVRLLGRIFHEADLVLKKRSLERTKQYIQYIDGQLRQVMTVDHRVSLTQLLLGQQEKLMLQSVELPYVAEVVVPPTIPKYPSSPGLRFVALVGLIGLLFGCVIAVGREVLR